MSAVATVVSALLWLAGLAVLLRWPGRTIGFGLALVAWTWDPGGFWFVLGLTWLCSTLWARYGPQERILARCPELALALVAAVVAVLAGGQLAAAALAVLVLSLGWFASTTLASVFAHRARTPVPAQEAPTHGEVPASTAGRLGPGTWQVNVGPCPSCDGLVVATGRNEPAPDGGSVFLAQATCPRCGLHLVGLGNAADPAGAVTWLDPTRREDIA